MTKPQHHEIVVIGAGICGASIANELLLRGKSVCIVDAASSPATACSRHEYAIAHPHIGKGSPRLLRLTRIAFLMAEARWGKTWSQHGIFQPSKKDRRHNLRRHNLRRHNLRRHILRRHIRRRHNLRRHIYRRHNRRCHIRLQDTILEMRRRKKIFRVKKILTGISTGS